MKRNNLYIIILLLLLLLNGEHLTAREKDNAEENNNIKSADLSVKHETKRSGLNGLYFENTLYALLNNTDVVGGCIMLDAWYRNYLDMGPEVLFRSSKIDIGIQEILTPAYNRISAFVALEPVVFFDITLRAGHDYIFDYYSVAGPDAEYNEDERDKVSKSNLYPRSGLRADVVPALKFANGPFIFLYTFSLTFHDYADHGYYYDYNTFIVHKGRDFFYRHEATVLYKLGDIMIGPKFEYSLVQSSQKNYMKSSVLFVYSPKWRWLKKTTRPFFAVTGGTYLRDRYRQGSFVYSFTFGCNYLLY